MAYNSKYTGAEIEDKLDNIPVDYVVADSTIQEDFEAGKLPSTTVNWEGVKNKPTTVEGYGITDAKIDRGTIFLGSASITPITEHQSGFNLLKTYTLEQNVSVVLITEDEEGKGFMVKEAIVEIVYPSVVSRVIKCMPAQVFNGEPVNNLYGYLYVDVNATQLYWVCKFTRLSKNTYLKGGASNGNAISELYYNGYNQNIQSDTEYIQAIGLTSTTTVPSGTIIKIYGR